MPHVSESRVFRIRCTSERRAVRRSRGSADYRCRFHKYLAPKRRRDLAPVPDLGASLCISSLAICASWSSASASSSFKTAAAALTVSSHKFSKYDNIERFHNTLKDRVKTLRGFGSRSGAINALDGFVIQYNFLRRHTALMGRTPAEKAGIRLPIKNGWGDLIQWAFLAVSERRSIDASI